MHKFRLEKIINGDILLLSEADYYHLIKVLRYKEKDIVICYDEDKEYKCVLISKGQKLLLKMVSSHSLLYKKPYNIIVYAGIIKKQNFELLIRLLNEQNVLKVVPVYFERSQGIYNLNLSRINNIISNSCKQCERFEKIILEKPIFFKDLFKTELNGIHIVASLNNSYSSNNFNNLNFDKNQKYNIFIGPEGGFSEKEEVWFRDNAINVKLNNLILKTETAASSLAAILIYKILEL
ncbi:MAG: 16S rRNA (uracil(1498)-N(3))-methyltransferase [Mycoplasmoidaceae bacterium]